MPNDTPNRPNVDPKDRSKKRGGFFGFLKKIFIGFFLLVIVGLGSLFVHYLLTQKDSVDFLPEDYLVYLQIPSLKEFYDDILHLDAATIVLSDNEMASVRDGLLQFKSLDVADNWFFRQLLDMELNFLVLPPDVPLIVFDLDWRSVLTRLVPFISNYVPIENLTKIQNEQDIYFIYQIDETTSFAFAFLDNLVIASTEVDAVLGALNASREGNTIANSTSEENLAKLGRSAEGRLRFMANTDALLEQLDDMEGANKDLFESLSFPKETFLTLSVDNERFGFQAEANVASDLDVLQPIIGFTPQPLEAVRMLPAETFYYTGINIANFKDMIDLALFLQGEELENNLNTVSGLSETLLDLSLDELLFDWIGTEVGVFGIKGIPDPVFYLKVSDQAKKLYAFEKLANSLFLEDDNTLVLDNVQIDRLKLPDFLAGLLGSIGVKLEFPYFIQRDNLFFVSLNPETLVKVAKAQSQGDTLANQEEFRAITQGVGFDPHLFMYYDLHQATPFFAQGNSVMAQVLRLYAKGVVTLHNRKGDWELKIQAVKSDRKGAREYPGFPREWNTSISEPLVRRYPGKGEPLLLYVDRFAKLRAETVSGTELWNVSVEPRTQLINADFGEDRFDSIIAYTPGSKLELYDLDGNTRHGFPVSYPWTSTFLPEARGRNLIAFDENNQQLVFLDREGRATPWPGIFERALRAAPSLRGNNVAYYPKDFTGTVYLTDENGESRPGWPVQGGSLSLGQPELISYQGLTRVAFLTQRGLLNLWGIDGVQNEGFPIELPGVYFQDLEVITDSNGEARGFVTMSNDGLISLVSPDGRLVAQKKIPRLNGQRAKLLVMDLTQDGIGEILTYGDSDFIRGFDWNLNSLEGFPIKGSYRPWLVDINLDQKLELVIPSTEGKVYSYTMDF